jgi:DNA-binding NarL/FixJ family response regulator
MTIRAILADDHAVVREGLRMLLEAEMDIEVVGEAENGRDALRQTKRLRPDVVVLDVAMPELNGIEASERIRAFDPSIRVIVLSMHSTKEHIFRALRAGAKGYVLKESAAAEVLTAVREVCSGRNYLSSKVSDEVIQGFLHPDARLNVETPLERLSAREREVLQLVVEGKSSAEIGKLLFLSSKTVDTYRSRLMRKLGVDDIAGLVRFAIQHKVIPAS